VLAPIDDACLQSSLCRLQARQTEEQDIEDVLDTAYRFSGVGRYTTIAPLQVRSELAAAAEHVAAAAPRRVLEIGTYTGGTLYTWCRAAESVETVISVDLPDGPTKPRFLDRAMPDTDVRFVRKNSQTRATRAEVERALDSEPVDFLFIDGDHTLDGVRRDFELYEPLVADGGLIAFHDIVTLEREEWNQVDELWSAIEPEYDTTEFVDETYDPREPVAVNGTKLTGHGFGFLRV
jgi:cephalosporin hydroxylase